MNSHIHIAAGMLAAVTLLIAAAAWRTRQQFSILLARTETAQQILTEGGDPAEAVRALEAEWARAQNSLRLLMPNAPLMDLNEAIARVRPEYEQDDDALSAELASIAADLTWLRARCGLRVL